MDTNNEVLELLKKVGGIITDSHIVYTSGTHGSIYLNKDALYPHPTYTSRIGELFAQKHKDLPIDVVVGPSLGGIILQTWTAYHLTQLTGREILGVYTEKDAESNQIFSRRGYAKFVTGKNILVVEDLANTGGSVKKVVNTVNAAGGNILAVSVMINRSPKTVTEETIEAPFDSLAIFPAEAFDPADCPLCKNNVPINITVGHGKKFLEQKNKPNYTQPLDDQH